MAETRIEVVEETSSRATSDTSAPGALLPSHFPNIYLTGASRVRGVMVSEAQPS